MFFIVTLLLLATGKFVVCDELITQSPDYSEKSGSYPGAARQTLGSLRPSEDFTNKKVHREKLARQMERERGGDRIQEDVYGEGHVVLYGRNEHAPPPIVQGIPGITLRNYGNGKQIPHSSMHDPIFKPMNERREETYGYNLNARGNKDSVFLDRIYEEDEGLLGSNHRHAGGELEIPGECDLKCEGLEFLCTKSCSCIHSDLHCDGQVDCGPDGEDENECEITEEMIKKMRSDCETDTATRHIMCPNTYICIKEEWLCDGDDDCSDFSDETHCGSKTNCSDDQFECMNGLCIPLEWLCDGDNDCRDNSEELNCTRTCTNDEFQCMDESCISVAFKCDGDADCEDGSDESSCDFPLPNCPEGEFKCKGVNGNGMGGPGGRCILNRFRCDGDNDCGDWSDEENCPKKAQTCSSNEFKCDDGRCLPLRWRCDLEQDCDSGEDEKGCSDIGNHDRECSDDEYTCKDGRCILKTWVCDGVADCKRGEEEMDCDVKCEVGQFSCPSKNSSPRQSYCVNQKHVCDGQKDCLGGEDEANCSTPHICPTTTRCQQNCVTTVANKEECSCKNGYILSENGNNCTDIDECQFTNSPVCSQTCNNTVGGFICGCITGYVLRPDLRTCKALGGAVKLIMANRADIRQVTLSNNQYTSIIKGLPNAIALDYHYQKDLLFWSDVSADVIKKSFMNGTSVKDVIKWGLESPGGLAVDWIHDLLFWTDSGTRRVEVSTFDGKMRAVIAANDLDKPRAIVVHPGKYLVFWSDWGPNAKIERSYMDGSERQPITNDGIYWPNGLAMDFSTDRIYWADAKHHVIENSKLDGTDRKKILSNNLPHPFALTIFEDNMFWTDWHTKTISSANKVTGKNFRHVHEGLHFPMDIHSYHVARQPAFENRCADDRRKLKGGCSHLCLPNRNSRRCACPIGLTLLDDQKTCTAIPDKLLLLARKKDIRMRQLDSKNPLKEIDMVIPLDNLKSTIALDWCSDTDQIFWTDVGRSTINRAHLNGSNQETVVISNLVSPAGLAYDWVTKKIYWTDAGTNRIEVSTIDGHHRALLVWKNIMKPRDIVVNPPAGQMFWSDWGDTPALERAGMDGMGRISIVSENLLYPNGLAIDFSNNRLYFVDAGTKALEYINFDGTGRNRLISDNLQHPFGLDVYDKTVFWSDWDTQSICTADKHTGKNRRSIITNTSDLMDIRVFHRKRKSVVNPCAIRNGECSHICLLNPKDYTCACPIGVKLTEDRKTCKEGPSNYILFAHRIDIRQVSLDIDYMIDVVLPLQPLSSVNALDVDLKTGDIYWADNIEDVIMKTTSDGINVQQIISESMDNVDGLVIDSITRKIYWTDAGRHSIEVSELDGNNRKVLVWQDLESPRGIAIDFEYGYLFFSDWGTTPRIERADMNGERRSRIVTSDLGWPNGLSVDKVEKKLYWTDALMTHIETCDFDGNFRSKFIEGLPHPYGITVGKHSIYWTDWKTTALHAVNKKNLTDRSIVANNLEGLMDVKVVETSDEMQDNPCGNNNGGCSHLCLRKPNGFSCQCPTGIKMKVKDGKECESLPKSYLLIALRSGIGRISLDTPEMFDVVLPIDGIHGAVVVDYHFNRSYLFYADVNVDAIKRVNMFNYTDTKTIVSSGLNTPNGIAVDWMADNLYWSDSALKIIEVSRLDGSCRKTILKDELDDVRSMILYRNLLFFADWGHNARIERSFLDGSERKSIVSTELGFPTGLAIDFAFKKLYWADALHDRVEVSDFSGKNRNKVIGHAEHPFGFTLTSSYYYFTDWFNKSVIRAPRHGGNVEEIRHSLRGALEIRSASQERQPVYYNPCVENNGGCSHLCLFMGGRNYICECPNYSDGRACKKQLKQSNMVQTDDDDATFAPSTTQSDVVDKVDSNQIIITVCITMVIIVVAVFLCAVFLYAYSTVDKRKSREDARLTFSNPNYNGSDFHGEGQNKSTFFKRFKYDRAQERVYEEKVLNPETASSTLMSSANPSPMPSHSKSSTILPLSTIG